MATQTDLSTYDLLVDGELVPAAAEERFETVNPATADAFATVARGREADVDRAVAAANDALADWRSTAPQERGRLLNDLAAEIRAQQESLALLETRDNGKPLSHARADVETCARYF
jgi:aldehyde dehydrogenase (NAD+)